jgi:hypothetical protein
VRTTAWQRAEKGWPPSFRSVQFPRRAADIAATGLLVAALTDAAAHHYERGLLRSPYGLAREHRRRAFADQASAVARRPWSQWEYSVGWCAIRDSNPEPAD